MLEEPVPLFNPLYTDELFHCYMLDKSIYHYRGVAWVYFLLLFCFCWKIMLTINVDPDLMSHYVASDLGLHCLPVTLL